MHDVLNDDGKAFLHILCHREFTYFMNQNDWMGRNFFTGGTIPSTKLFQFFNDHLKIKDTWYLHGTDYGKTLDAWLHKMQEKKIEVISIFIGFFNAVVLLQCRLTLLNIWYVSWQK